MARSTRPCRITNEPAAAPAGTLRPVRAGQAPSSVILFGCEETTSSFRRPVPSPCAGGGNAGRGRTTAAAAATSEAATAATRTGAPYCPTRLAAAPAGEPREGAAELGGDARHGL